MLSLVKDKYHEDVFCKTQDFSIPRMGRRHEGGDVVYIIRWL